MSKLSNELLMLKYLSNGRKYNIQELSELLEVTPRMIRLYKEDLDEAGIYIDTIMGPYGGYVLNQEVIISNKKLIDNTLDNKDLNKYNIINKGIKERRKIKIIYNSNRDMNKERIIQPAQVYLFKEGWFCIAFCELRQEMRQFDFNNIIDIELLDDNF